MWEAFCHLEYIVWSPNSTVQLLRKQLLSSMPFPCQLLTWDDTVSATVDMQEELVKWFSRRSSYGFLESAGGKKNWLLGNMLYSRILKDFPATRLLIFTFKKDSWWVNNKLLLIIGSIGHMKTSEMYLTSRDFLLSSCLHFSLYSVWG